MALLPRRRFDFHYHFPVILLMAVLVGQTALEIMPAWSPWVRLIGIILVIVGFPLIRKSYAMVPEVALYGLFVCWSIVTGFVVADNKPLFLQTMQTLIQIFMLMLIVFALFRRHQTFTYCWVIFVINALFMVGYGIFTQGFALFSPSMMENRLNPLSGTGTGANGFGLYSVVGIVSAIALLPRLKLPLQIVCVGCIGLFTSAVFLSGSRKSFFALLFIIAIIALSWSLQNFGQLWRRVPLLLLVGGCGYLLVNYALSQPVLGSRILSSIEERGDPIREELYQEAIDMFLASPIAGVGLGNFAYHSQYKTYAHSDYAESLADTGLVGFLLYLSIYPLLFIRLYRLMKLVSVHGQRRLYWDLCVMFALLAGYLFNGIGAPNFLDPKAMFFIFAMLGYIYAIPIRGGKTQIMHSRQITTGFVPTGAR